jgi:putative heme transporter
VESPGHADPAHGGSSTEGQKAPRWHLIVQTVAVVAVAGGVVVALYLQHGTIGNGLGHIGNLRWRWVVLASLCELVSMAALAALYRDLLGANDTRLGLPWILACCLASNAISLSIPVIGSGIASRRTYRRFRQAGADTTTASFALTVGGVVSTVTMASVIVAAAMLSGNPSAAVSGVLGAVVMLGAAVAIGVELRSDKGRKRLVWVSRFALAWSKRLTHRPKGEPETLARNAVDSLERMRLGAAVTVRVVAWGLLNWWTDVACLLFILWAVGVDHLAPGKIMIVWLAGIGAASLSPTPGGIGAVEIAMVAALAAFGVRGPDAILAVLVYRVITFKVLGSLWGVVYEYLDRHRGTVGKNEGMVT